jgi:excinuclease ABC subunit A
MPSDSAPPSTGPSAIRIRGARQNNLKNLSLDIPHNELVVVTGVSGSGKSSLVFDTLYAEGQRRYVETFSPYARQFLDRMDKPQVDRIEGVPPAIAIDQTNPVRTSRSTVGTMTELADHFKLLYARAAKLHCRCCGKPVSRDTPATIFEDLSARVAAAGDPRLVVSFPVTVPGNFSDEEITGLLAQQGYTRIHARDGDVLHVVQDRFRLGNAEHARVMEALEIGLSAGHGRLSVHALADAGETRWKFSSGLHCADCDIAYSDPLPSLFSFNSPVGACETCKGFGRVIGVDFSLVVPDESKTLAEGAVKPWQSPSFKECQDDLVKMAKKYGVAMDIPVRDLPAEHREWLFEGDPKWKSWDSSWPRYWYGIRHFFDWLESKAYKMHIRVLLSRYRSYTECPACHGARLKPDALLWRLPAAGGDWAIHELMARPVDEIVPFVAGLVLPAPLDEATELLLGEIKGRLKYLQDVGLSYLTLDRQSRTLSGGEVQRINLTTALGTSLVNTLFVLDEPSIGLHPRDINRILGVMERLRDAGNSLVVVEHDPQLMLAADRLLDIGPGPGERGGEIVAYGPPVSIANDPGSLTGAYLAGRKRVDARRRFRPVATDAPRLTLKGARQHNLQGVDLAIPLQRLVGITGVSGSGKSTLIQDVLYPALAKHFGQPADVPGAFDGFAGVDAIKGVVMVDQSPIGKSARSNPVSYVGAWDAIRKLYANLEESKERGYTPGTFSFNSGTGRCPTCTGSGFEHVEMQFLSDVYLRCPDCDGKRYRPEILALSWRGKGVADVLEMTVSEALAFFADQKAVLAALAPLADVGLEYLRLGQPVPTLSGGEAQRLKLAGYLAEAAQLAARKAKKAASGDEPGLLFLFDEPTTGLHFEDVARLLSAFEKLLDAGHSLVVIEHNLDVIAAADWLVDLGPEGGSGGGRIVAEGTPATLIATPASHTGKALADYAAQLANMQAAPVVAEPPVRYRPVADNAITIRHARHHNLKNISLDIPRDQFTVITGLSGSGKSTLAFDIVFGEGQRRYLESLNAYARQFAQPSARPEVDAIFGIPAHGGHRAAGQPRRTQEHGGHPHRDPALPAPAVHQAGHPVLPLLRRAGDAPELRVHRCPHHARLQGPLHRAAGAADHQPQGPVHRPGQVGAGQGFRAAACRWRLSADEEVAAPRPLQGAQHRAAGGHGEGGADTEALLREHVTAALEHGKGVLKLLPLDEPGGALTTLSTLRACPDCGTSFPEPDPRLFSYNAKHGWCPDCYGTGIKIAAKVEDPDALDLGELEHETDEVCPSCDGARLNPVARAVRFRDLGLHELASLAVGKVSGFFEGLQLAHREAEIGRDLVAEIRGRLDFLQKVGLGYLALDRAAPTLSGGEAQRIRLAAQLGSNLTGVCYILDEPTIGLHPRDNQLLLDTLEALKARGNTLLVVEHDEDTIRRADHVIDIGPGAGVRGGQIIAQGRLADLMAAPDSATGRCFKHPLIHPLAPRRAVADDHPALVVRNATLHNLKGVSARVPLARLTVVTGVSGSGKSTFARDVLHASLAAAAPVGCAALDGREQIGRLLEVDQTPIGKTPRSCPATYIGFWDAIRKMFAETTEAKMRGWTASRFSFNTGAGRCPVCEGQGQITIEMNFLPDVKMPCEACGGARFNPETLTVQWKGKSVAEVLNMAVEDAVDFFAAHPSIAHPLRLLQDVGLGYLTLGQPSPTLSGGEAQRIKLVSELAKVRGRAGESATGPGRPLPPEKHTLYVLDEPTVGLHMADVEKLIHVLHRLADAGHTVLVIEHDLDLMAEADWIIDLGPEGGDGGGEIVAEGPPEAVVQVARSHTGRILVEFMAARRAS